MLCETQSWDTAALSKGFNMCQSYDGWLSLTSHVNAARVMSNWTKPTVLLTKQSPIGNLRHLNSIWTFSTFWNQTYFTSRLLRNCWALQGSPQHLKTAQNSTSLHLWPGEGEEGEKETGYNPCQLPSEKQWCSSVWAFRKGADCVLDLLTQTLVSVIDFLMQKTLAEKLSVCRMDKSWGFALACQYT